MRFDSMFESSESNSDSESETKPGDGITEDDDDNENLNHGNICSGGDEKGMFVAASE